MPLQEGQTGTAPDGTRVVVRGGRVVPLPPVKLTPQEEGELVDARRAAGMMGDMTDQASRFIELNRKAATGPAYGFGPLRAVAGMVNPAISQMDALQARMAPAQRVPGSGTTSDRDLALFMQAIPSTSRMGTANQEIAKDMATLAAKQQAKAKFLDDYAMKNGTLKGSVEAFDRVWGQRNRGGAADSGSQKRPPLSAFQK